MLHAHPGILGILWIVVLGLLFLLVPVNPTGRDILMALVLWLLPAGVLVAITYWWWRHRRL